MSDIELAQGGHDWHLPLGHEETLWKQHIGGGRTFIDIGAHVGTWALNLAPHFERVIAFEPDPRAHGLLSENLRLNGIKNVEVIPKAITNQTGPVTFHLYDCSSVNSIMDPARIGRADEPVESRTVEAVSLDDFIRSRGINDVDFIKIDVEAAEMVVLEGALETFRSQTPDFSIEMHGFFWDRIRKQLSFMECDVLDGGQLGFTLSKHRDSWPGLEAAGFDVYPAAPDRGRMLALRERQGIPFNLDLEGFRGADFPGHEP